MGEGKKLKERERKARMREKRVERQGCMTRKKKTVGRKENKNQEKRKV